MFRVPICMLRRSTHCLWRPGDSWQPDQWLDDYGYDPRVLDELEFFHIKLERHNEIFAEGALYETIINVEESAVNFAEYLGHYGHPTTQEAPCPPLLSCNGGRSEIRSRFRSAISLWIDRRQKVDIIRDELEGRSIAVLRDRNSSRDCSVFA